MARTALLTLGRLPKGLDIARALYGAGWRVIIAEPFGWHLCRPSHAVSTCFKVTAPVQDEDAYLAELLDIVRREAVELVVPISEEAMYAAALKQHLPMGTLFFGADRTLIRALHDKLGFVDRARALGLAVPETHRLGTPEAETLAARTDVVVKPVYSSAGVGVRFGDQGAELPAPDPIEPALVQTRLPGRARSSLSIAHEGRLIASVFYEGTVMSHTVAVAFRRIEAPDLEAWIAPFVDACHYTGFIAFDFIDDAEGQPHAIECNPRCNSGVHYFTEAGLASALLDPAGCTSVSMRPEMLMQQFFPCLTETQATVFKAERRRNNWRYLTGSKDVTWSPRDPWPFVLMTFTSWNILKRAIFKGESFGEAAVADIAWHGEPQTGAAAANRSTTRQMI